MDVDNAGVNESYNAVMNIILQNSDDENNSQDNLNETAQSADNLWVSNYSLPELSSFEPQALNFLDDITDYEDKNELSQYLGPESSTSYELPEGSTYNFTSATILTNESVPFKPITLPSSGIALEVADNPTNQKQDSTPQKKGRCLKRRATSPIEKDQKKKINLQSFISHSWLPNVKRTEHLLQTCIEKIDTLQKTVEKFQDSNTKKFNIVIKNNTCGKEIRKLTDIEELLTHVSITLERQQQQHSLSWRDHTG